MKDQDKYQEPFILELPNTRVRVFCPMLSDIEQERRMKIIHDAAADLLKSLVNK